ncbi:MAG: hypothetical protein SFU25_00445 [Candidatus Caenarcaniphilales bacterium]|nr:hypothetical protein [Candidatus Caenarcaniphilales bacterium]
MTNEEEIIKVLAKFKFDLVWDEIVGIFEQVPASVREQLEKHYEDALKMASSKLKMEVEDLRDKVEDLAYQSINGISYSQSEVKARLREYGIEDKSN